MLCAGSYIKVGSLTTLQHCKHLQVNKFKPCSQQHQQRCQFSAGASVALHNTTQPVAAENKIQPLLMQASKTVHFVLTTTQERTIRIYLPGPGSFLAGSLEDSNCSKALTSIRTAERPSLWLLKIGHVFKTDANGVAGMLGR